MSANATPGGEPPLPPQILLYQLAIGHYVSRALDLAARLGVADLLSGGPRGYAELAEATNTDARSLARVLRLLVGVGVFEERDPDRIALAPLGELLRSDAPGSMRSAVRLFAGAGVQERWKELEYCVRTGEPAFRRTSPDGNAFDHFDPEQAEVFDEAMATFTRSIAAGVAAAYDFGGFARVVDVGGGSGALLLGILAAYPALRCTVFDLAPAAERARDAIAAAGLADRCNAVAGDFFESVPKDADAYLIKHVIHDWDDERALAILERCREALPRSGKVLILEGIYPERFDRSVASRGAAANDVNMLVCTGGRQRSESEFRSLLGRAALRLTRIVPTPSPVHVIEAERG